MSESPRIGYLTSMFARPSDTFIRNEVNQLRQLGVEITTFSIRRPRIDQAVEDDVRDHQASTEYLLDAGAAAILFRAFLGAVTCPLQFLRTARLAWRTSAPGVRGALLQGAYLIEALYLAWRLRQRRIELLHNHIGENSASVAMLAAESCGIPFSMTIHGPGEFFAPQRWALGEKLSRAAFTACISDFCRSQCLLFAPEGAWPKLHVVRCSVQPMFVEEPPTPHFLDHSHFVCVGRLSVEKGQRLLLEATRCLIARNHSIRVSLVGDGPDRVLLERRVQEWGLVDHVAILGWQSSQAIRQMLGDSTALVIASMAEGLPVVAMEAIAARCPVIATNIAAMAELIHDGRSGWLIPAGSIEHLADAMERAARCTPDELRAMGEMGRRLILERHHPHTQARRLMTLFQAAVNRPQNSPPPIARRSKS